MSLAPDLQPFDPVLGEPLRLHRRRSGSAPPRG